MKPYSPARRRIITATNTPKLGTSANHETERDQQRHRHQQHADAELLRHPAGNEQLRRMASACTVASIRPNTRVCAALSGNAASTSPRLFDVRKVLALASSTTNRAMPSMARRAQHVGHALERIAAQRARALRGFVRVQRMRVAPVLNRARGEGHADEQDRDQQQRPGMADDPDQHHPEQRTGQPAGAGPHSINAANTRFQARAAANKVDQHAPRQRDGDHVEHRQPDVERAPARRRRGWR